MTSQSVSTYVFTDAVPTVDESLSPALATSKSSSDLILSDLSETLSSICSSYTPVEPITLPTKFIAHIDSLFEYQVEAFCYSPASLIYYTVTLADGSSLPSWLSFEASGTGNVLTGTPTSGASTTIEILFNVALNSDSSNFQQVTVPLYINTKPVVQNSIDDVISRSRVILFVDIPVSTFTDADGDTLTISVTQKPSWMVYLNDKLQGTPSSSDIGEYTINVQAMDTNDGIVVESFKIKINKNFVPVVVTRIPNQTIPKNIAYSYIIPKSYFDDANAEDTLTISIDNTNYDWLSLNVVSWELSGTPTEDNEYNVTVTVSDSYDSLSTSFLLVTGSGAANNAPVVANSAKSLTIYFSKVFSESIGSNLFTDPDGDSLTYRVKYQDGSSLDSWINFDQSEFNFYGTVPSKSDIGNNINLDLMITATDGEGGSNIQNFSIMITEESSESNNIVVVILSVLLTVVLLTGAAVVLILTYKYCKRKTSNTIHPETNNQSKGIKKYLDQETVSDGKHDKERPIETHRELRETENVGSNMSEDGNDLELVNQMTKYVLTGDQF